MLYSTCRLNFVHIYVVSKKEGGVRFVTLRGFSIDRVSGRRSRSYNVAGGSPELPGEGYTMYRRARGCRQAAISRNVDFGLLFQKNTAYVIIGAKKTRRLPEKTKKWSKVRVVLLEDSKSTRQEVGCIKPLSRTNTLTLFIIE